MFERAVLLERLQLGVLRFGATFVAAMSAMWIRHAYFLGTSGTPWRLYVVPACLAGVLVAAVAGPVPVRPKTGAVMPHLTSSVRAIATATVILLALSFFVRGESYSRASVIFFLPLAGLGLFIAEEVHLGLMRRIRSSRSASRRVLVAGFHSLGRRLAKALEEDPACLEVVGFIDDSIETDPNSGLPRLGRMADLRELIATHQIDCLVITSEGRSSEEVQNLIGVSMAAGVQWLLVPNILDLVLDRVRIEVLHGLPLVLERGNQLVGHDWFIKRSFDVFVASLGLILFSPLIAISALAVKLTSRGPIIFKQTRIGMGGEPFTFYKLRTMEHEATEATHAEYARRWIFGNTGKYGEDSAVHKLQADGRVTRVGRILRAASIDELPQLWNVVRGDMSLVGPRPPIPYELENYTEWHRRRLAVPPGITGLWQVNGRNSLSFEEMVQLDLDYIETWSIGLDLKILFRTVPALVLHRGS